MSIDTFAKETRKIIEHENSLENNRIQWMLIAEGLLFTAFGVLLQSNSLKGIAVKLFTIIISIAGIVIAYSCGVHLKHGRRAIENALKNFDEQRKDVEYNGPSIIGLDVTKLDNFERHSIPPYILPKTFVLAWIAIDLIILKNIH